ncbi:hypothetical protein HPP92_020339 [Vanilla planifolia]|uniref:Uncharacterized protein n=1 Tax=Vanilla planifolia TaxID=51239 RepID=A0A835PZI6_VANPL|nr:hypothetical protein HPP92_020339 [Vanilla planifolia]
MDNEMRSLEDANSNLGEPLMPCEPIKKGKLEKGRHQVGQEIWRDLWDSRLAKHMDDASVVPRCSHNLVATWRDLVLIPLLVIDFRILRPFASTMSSKSP